MILMMYALSNGVRSMASHGLTGSCPLCELDVIPKCGEIKIWHWAHKADADCDSFKENESQWHRDWKEVFPEENREVLIKKGNNIHYADIQTKADTVIEFQNSSINFEQIRERESFYGPNMVWIFNCNQALDRIEWSGYDLKWWSPRRDYARCNRPVFLDIGDYLFEIGNIRRERSGVIPTWFISGQKITISGFLNQVNVIPGNLSVVCPSIVDGVMVKELPYRACCWHREQKHPRCFESYWPWENEKGCQQWQYNFNRFNRLN